MEMNMTEDELTSNILKLAFDIRVGCKKSGDIMFSTCDSKLDNHITWVMSSQSGKIHIRRCNQAYGPELDIESFLMLKDSKPILNEVLIKMIELKDKLSQIAHCELQLARG